MTKSQKYDFAKVSVRPEVKREIDILSAMQQRPVYELVAEMLANYKLISVTTLPHPVDGQVVPVLHVAGN